MRDFSMPFEWLQVLAHPTTKDKSSLMMALKYDMTVRDVHDLIEYQHYEDWMSNEERIRTERGRN